MSPVMMTSGDASGRIGCRVRSSRSSSISPDPIAQQNHVLRHAVSNVTAEKLQLQTRIMELHAHEAARVTQLSAIEKKVERKERQHKEDQRRCIKFSKRWQRLKKKY